MYIHVHVHCTCVYDCFPGPYESLRGSFSFLPPLTSLAPTFLLLSHSHPLLTLHFSYFTYTAGIHDSDWVSLSPPSLPPSLPFSLLSLSLSLPPTFYLCCWCRWPVLSRRQVSLVSRRFNSCTTVCCLSSPVAMSVAVALSPLLPSSFSLEGMVH